jgi:hypothetical protein
MDHQARTYSVVLSGRARNATIECRQHRVGRSLDEMARHLAEAASIENGRRFHLVETSHGAQRSECASHWITLRSLTTLPCRCPRDKSVRQERQGFSRF